MKVATRFALQGVAAVVMGIGLCPEARAQDVDTCIAANEKAVQSRKAGRLVEERASLSVCGAAACPDPVRTSCQQRLAATNGAVPSVVFQVKDTAGNDLSSWRVTRDGERMGEEAVGRAIELDPGEHTFVFEAEGHPTVQKRLVVVEGVKNRREVVVMPDSRLSPSSESHGAGDARRTIGLIVGGVGLAGIVAGSVAGVLASSTWKTAQQEWSSAQAKCGPSSCPAYTQAIGDQQSAARDATVSTIAFVAGGVALATGVVLFLTAPKRSKEGAAAAALRIVPDAGPGGGGLVLRGGF